MMLTADHDGVLVDDVVREWAERHGRPFTLRLTGPAGGTRGSDGPVLELDAAEFCRVISGRGTPAQHRGALLISGTATHHKTRHHDTRGDHVEAVTRVPHRPGEYVAVTSGSRAFHVRVRGDVVTVVAAFDLLPRDPEDNNESCALKAVGSRLAAVWADRGAGVPFTSSLREIGRLAPRRDTVAIDLARRPHLLGTFDGRKIEAVTLLGTATPRPRRPAGHRRRERRRLGRAALTGQARRLVHTS